MKMKKLLSSIYLLAQDKLQTAYLRLLTDTGVYFGMAQDVAEEEAQKILHFEMELAEIINKKSKQTDNRQHDVTINKVS